MALAVVTAAAGGLTFFLPDVLRGPAAMNGSARGTGIVLLVGTIPVLLISAWISARSPSYAWRYVWAGTVAHVLYQSVLFLFATPFNELFLLYVAMFGLAIATAVAVLTCFDAEEMRTASAAGMPRRGISIYIGLVVAANAALWLRSVVDGLLADGRPAFLEGTGLATNPVYVQDLGFWLPLMALGAWWFWRDRAWGYVVVGAVLVMWTIESATVAVDQFMGSAADPASNVATTAGVWIFVVLGLVNLVPLAAFLRHVRRIGA